MELNSWLIDKSAFVRLRQSLDVSIWMERIGEGRVRVTPITLLEVGFSARSARELNFDFQQPPISLLKVEYMSPRIEERALEIQLLLAERGYHRAAAVPDLLVAAAADLLGLIVLYVDKDYELIAELTGQVIERLRY